MGDPINCTQHALKAFICSLDAEEGSSPTSSSDTAPSAPLRSTPTASKCSCNDRQRDTCPGSLSLGTSQHGTPPHGEAELISSRADFPASHIAWQDTEQGEAIHATFGTRWQELLEKYDLDMSFVKTYQECLAAPPACAYAAGLIDGEGAIGLAVSAHKGRRAFSPEVRISLATKGKPALEFMHKHFGGTLKPDRPIRQGKWSATWMWRIGGHAAGKFLVVVGPFLQLKAEQAMIGLKALWVRDTATNRRHNGTAEWTDSMVSMCERLKARITVLNQRGIPPFPPGAFAQLVAAQWVTTQLDLLNRSLVPFSGTWPAWGTMRDGACWEQATLVPGIGGSGRGFLPTATQDSVAMRTKRYAQGGMPLTAMLPTPNVPNGGRRMNREDVLNKGKTPRGKRQVDLESALRFIPTPTASMQTMADLFQAQYAGTDPQRPSYATASARDWKSGKASHKTMERNSRPLNEQVQEVLQGSLNPTWLEWYMGWPMGFTALPGTSPTCLTSTAFQQWLLAYQTALSALWHSAMARYHSVQRSRGRY